MSKIIRDDDIIFENIHSRQDVTLRHEGDGFDLVFQSGCVFQQRATHQSIKMGNFTIQLSQDSEKLEVRKNNNILFKITE